MAKKNQMEKLKVLKYNQIYMTRLGIYSNRLTEPTNEFFKSIFAYYILNQMFVCLAASGAFILKYPYDIKHALGATKIFFAIMQCIGMFFGIGLKMVKMKAVHVELQQIVDKVEDNVEAQNIYRKCELKCRKHTKVLSYFVIFHTSIFPITLTYVLICIVSGNYDTSSLFLPMSMVLPFDQSNLRGWLMMWLNQYSGAFCYALAMTAITSYFVSGCYYIYAMIEHFSVLMNSVSVDVERMQLEQRSRKVEQQIIAQLGDIVKFHTKIYEILYMLIDICSAPIFALLPANVILMSISMYDLEVSIKNIDISVLLWDISCILCALFWPTFISYYASHTTDRVLSISNVAYNSNWFQFPPKLQKYVILIIARSQEPVYFSGLGLLHCTLETFGEYVKISSSYYVMFRAIAQR